MQLSKSEYIKFLKHPAWLWLKKHQKHRLPEPDENLQAVFAMGNRFEKIVQERFEDGMEIGFDKDDFETCENMPERTQQAINSGAVTIFQARFETDQLTCITDIIERVEDRTFDLYEVKSSTRVKLEHKHDLAFQTVVLEDSGLEVNDIFVIYVNSDYKREGEIEPEKISNIENVTDEVREKIDETKQNVQRAFEVISSEEMPNPSPSNKQMGKARDWMEIYEHIVDIQKHSIYNLTGATDKLKQLEKQGIETVEKVPEDIGVSKRKQRYIKATKQDERIIKEEKIKEFLDQLTYPLCFLDYETASDVVPPYEQTSPYQQIPFQYSLHILDKSESELKHKEYLHQDQNHPVPPLVEQLHKDIGDTGSVIVWYKNFEKGRNTEMAEIHPEYSGFLCDLNDRIVDLMVPFANGWFVDKEFIGSASIKNVLPVLVPDLSYKDLEVQDGRSAQRKWMDVVLRDKEIDKEKLFDELVEYCELDTLAMVEIYRVLKEVVN